MNILHQYEPLSDEMITDEDGIAELIITPNTIWVPACEDESFITDSQYNAIKVTHDTVHCNECSEIIQEQSKEIAWSIEFSRPIRAKIGKLLMRVGAKLSYGSMWDVMIEDAYDHEE